MITKTVWISENFKDELIDGLELLLTEHQHILVKDRVTAEIQLECKHICDNKLIIKKRENCCVIYYSQKAHFFRGVSLLLQNKAKEQFTIEETANFESNGIMMDCSRNCVPKVETIKKYIMRLAEFGMNRLYLYMEDTMEIDGYPYWGYLRGRLTKRELKECDAYGRLFGVTLIPCIQTLAHLRSALKQPMFDAYKDIDDILLLQDENTRNLLKDILKTVAECFSGGIVHLGMDEAANLGRGRFLDKYGYHEPSKIMKLHLEWLEVMCKELNLKPMIWSDMYLKLNFGVEDYYSLSEDAEPRNKENMSDKIALCYWDYYNEGIEFYKKYIRLHQKLGNPVIFAGGAWTWNGIAPGISKALLSTKDALTACCEMRINDVFCTVWMDNGAETPLVTMLPILAVYGEYGFSKEPSKDKIAERFEFCFKMKWDNFCLLDAFDNPQYEEGGHNRYCENPSKTILYEDNLMGLFIKMFDEVKLKKRYELLAKNLRSIVDDSEDLEEEQIFEYYQLLAEILSQKAGITEQIQKSYLKKEFKIMESISENELKRIEELTEVLRNKRQRIWMDEYKPFGYEILDIRFAGVAVRAKSAANRLTQYIRGEIDCIPEVEEKILPYKTTEMLEKELLHGYYMWEKIISAGNIDGV
ncbi:beta-N-acetylhexosaminidase [Mediterraneibacter gnavus]|uniref:Beta-N-acetylhexosaminidase n=1 Tax=Mediterraneibacter gnavus TaxID=33038 RepID=A0A412BU81_MEDGN|nr:beta-N-acetylhexosaminidase [Mediterraneibacter gnavus]RGQ63333.1 beta-N-acetylhexosaminidase [Mediterraneibacter gnavus]